MVERSTESLQVEIKDKETEFEKCMYDSQYRTAAQYTKKSLHFQGSILPSPNRTVCRQFVATGSPRIPALGDFPTGTNVKVDTDHNDEARSQSSDEAKCEIPFLRDSNSNQ